MNNNTKLKLKKKERKKTKKNMLNIIVHKGNAKICSTLLSIREMQTKTTLKVHCTPIRIVKILNIIIPNVGENVEQLKFYPFLVEMQNQTITLEKSVTSSYKVKPTLAIRFSNSTPRHL